MQYNSLDDFLTKGRSRLEKGPVALIFVEDNTEVHSTLSHHLDLGFRDVVAFMPASIALPQNLEAEVHRVEMDCGRSDRVFEAINAVTAKATPGCWIYYGFNAEYLFFPFRETRSIGEMLTFHTEERRSSMLTYVVDLYADNLAQNPDAVSIETAMLDRTGYYAQARQDPRSKATLERQFDFYGGLRWRFEEHIPAAGRRIDRIALFRAKPGLTLAPTHQFSDAEYNTYACPWHHNLTAAICSFRAAKALRRNPGSRDAISSFTCRNSVPFEWNSRQLLDLGLMEPGQWF